MCPYKNEDGDVSIIEYVNLQNALSDNYIFYKCKCKEFLRVRRDYTTEVQWYNKESNLLDCH